jgi:Cytochrome c554 and c-prime
MGIKLKYHRSGLVLFIIVMSMFIFVTCIDHGKEQKLVNENVSDEQTEFEDYAISLKCAGCHNEIYKNHIKTAHYLSGQPATEEFIKGSFKKGGNTYRYSPSILLAMEKRGSGYYQIAYYKDVEKKAMRFDIVIGSSVMGQSFLTWRKNRLYQLPITYFTAANQWSNSPGFPSEKVLIDRPITSRCLECHTTFAKGISGPALEPVEFDHNKIIYGIDCQKCHGPAAKHVEYQTLNPQEKNAKYIINPSKLTRLQQLDICALCHGGNIQKTKPSFEFTAGKTLSDYFTIDSLNNDIVINGSGIDVHGNQVGLLKASKCFRMSSTMTCNTCHNTHNNERGKKELFSQRCITCHNPTSDKLNTPTHALITAIEKNCIDCHMPAQPSKSIAVFLQGEETPKASLLRTHYIGIYADQSKKYLKAN